MRSSAPLRVAAGSLAAALVFGLAPACERTTIARSAIDDYPDPPQELDYFDALEEKSVVTNNDALHAFLLIADGEDHWGSFEARVREAKRRDWLPERWDEPANESAEAGWISRVACMLARINGGLTMMVFGPIPRYAVRELGNRQILVGKREGQALTGLEFTDFLGRLDRMSDLRQYSASGSTPMSGQGGAGSGASGATEPRLQPPIGRVDPIGRLE